MMEERPVGIVIALVGAVGTAIAALANPLGIGETEVFGWLQITGVIVGAVVTLLGLALAMEWVPYPARRRADAASSSTPQTTVVRDSTHDRTV
jgi:NADH:ubiquinone oxidoreductase subunit 6 (subunit J)